MESVHGTEEQVQPRCKVTLRSQPAQQGNKQLWAWMSWPQGSDHYSSTTGGRSWWVVGEKRFSDCHTQLASPQFLLDHLWNFPFIFLVQEVYKSLVLCLMDSTLLPFRDQDFLPPAPCSSTEVHLCPLSLFRLEFFFKPSFLMSWDCPNNLLLFWKSYHVRVTTYVRFLPLWWGLCVFGTLDVCLFLLRFFFNWEERYTERNRQKDLHPPDSVSKQLPWPELYSCEPRSL